MCLLSIKMFEKFELLDISRRKQHRLKKLEKSNSLLCVNIWVGDEYFVAFITVSHFFKIHLKEFSSMFNRLASTYTEKINFAKYLIEVQVSYCAVTQ